MHPNVRAICLAFALLSTAACVHHAARPGDELAHTTAAWKKLETAPYRGKQDDIVFVDAETGWYVNGAGKIYKTLDGGKTWLEKQSRPGTYFRAIGFVDAQHGFAGNIAPDYFPGVTDYTALYETKDGGETWAAAENVPLPKGAGVCAIDVLHDSFINAGHLDQRAIVHVAGRVGGPAWLLRSLDGGATWKTIDLNDKAAMILDVKFVDANHGIVVAGSDREVEQSHALILRTEDGGATWTKAYESARPFELTWKASFPTREVGYVTVQSYDPDPKVTQRFVAKTTDGGRTWTELPLVADHEQNEFGVAFASPDVGWVGAMKGGFFTTDGGKSWRPVDMGRAVNKIRLLHDTRGWVGYAIGVDVYKLDARQSAQVSGSASAAIMSKE